MILIFISDIFQSHYRTLIQFEIILFQIACVWIFPFICLLPTLFGSWGQLGLECSSRGCNVIDDEYGKNPKNVLVGVGTILPVVILIVADVSIFWKMKVSIRILETSSKSYKSTESL